MPIIKSAKKRVKVAAKANVRNSRVRLEVRDSLKAYVAALESGQAAKIAESHRIATRAIDNAAKKAVIHKNKAARKKSQLSKMAKAQGYKPTAHSLKPKAKTINPKSKTVKKTATKTKK